MEYKMKEISGIKISVTELNKYFALNVNIIQKRVCTTYTRASTDNKLFRCKYRYFKITVMHAISI